jgi:DtxR family manganese transport transcriptional regulator
MGWWLHIDVSIELPAGAAQGAAGATIPALTVSATVSEMARKATAKHAQPALELPAELIQARRFGKARSAQSGALLEDYVELIADLLASAGEARPTDIARRLGVSHATAIKTITRLKREGLATARPYRGVFLTEGGHELAARVRARHRLVVDVLLALGVPAEAAEADAEGIEHHVSETTLRAFGRFLSS